MAAPKFDPSKPFDEVQGPKFDESKPFEPVSPPSAPQPEAAPDPGVLTSMGRGFVQGGTLGFGDEAGGALQGGLQALANLGAKLNASGHSGLADALGKIGIEAHYGTDSVAGTYRHARDSMREQDAEAARAHPLAFGGGAIAGALATAKPVGAAAKALGLGGKGLVPALKLGAALGAVTGLGTSNADSPGEMAKDALGINGAKQTVRDLSAGNYGTAALDALGSGALGGALATVGGYGLGKAISPTMDALAIKTGRKALTNGARQLSNRLPVSEDAVRAALQSEAIQPMSTTEATHARLEHLLGHDVVYPEPPAPGTPMALYGELIDALEKNGAKGAAVRPLVDKLLSTAAEEEMNSGANKAVANTYQAEGENIENVAPKVSGPDGSPQPAENLGLRQGERIKRDLQSQAKWNRTTDTNINQAKKRISGMVREANEQAIADSAAAQPNNAQLQTLNQLFVPAKQTIGNLSEAEQAALEGMSRGAHRGTLNLPEQIEAARAFSEGKPQNLIGLIAHAMARPYASSTLATGAFALSKPDVVAQLAALLQRGKEAGGAKAPETWIDADGVPHVVVHTGR